MLSPWISLGIHEKGWEVMRTTVEFQHTPGEVWDLTAFCNDSRAEFVRLEHIGITGEMRS